MIVAFMGNDSNQAVIIGQIPHPKTHRRPSFLDLLKPQFKWRRHVQGIDMGVTMNGDIEVDMSSASPGAIVPIGGAEVPAPGPAPLSGNITLTMFTGTLPAGTKLRVVDSVLSAPEPVILGDSWLTDVTADLAALAAASAARFVPAISSAAPTRSGR